MLIIADILLALFHFAIVSFNVLGWIWPRARKAHLVILCLTTISWIGVGWWVGNVGYCFLTDWHWDIKRELGERNLPNSFIKYYADRLLGFDTNTLVIDVVTASGLIFGVTMAAWKNNLLYKLFGKRYFES